MAMPTSSSILPLLEYVDLATTVPTANLQVPNVQVACQIYEDGTR